MLKLNNTRKSDRDLYNYSSQDFIPIACHYDANTLLTKNGELLQIIQINGINAEQVSDSLFNLRSMVRAAIKNNVESDHFAFWIHTVRRKTNLDDMAPYKKLLPAMVHDIWRRKNYWDDKFVNTLYISIIYKSPNLDVTTNLNSFSHSFSPKTIVDFHQRYFADAHNKLQIAVDGVLKDLSEYGAEKLGMRFEGEDCYSDPIFLFRRIIHLSENDTLVPVADLSYSLASHQYAVGSDKIEVISTEGKKFAGIISIKEYQEISADALDSFLHVPVELIATEVFYFTSRKAVEPHFKEQDYILQVSGDEKLREETGLKQVMNREDDSPTKFCHQQISITIIGDDLAKLDHQMKHASEELSAIGVVHVKEDINLEQAFWAQLPGNFSFLKRMTPNIFSNSAALASLHNFPTGLKYSPWGRSVTLLRTERGTPYFAGFHGADERANLCIYGNSQTGKTVLMNFLLSESIKFEPDILYITEGTDAKIFVEAIEGTWESAGTKLINPFLCADSPETREFAKEFIRILAGHYVEALPEDSLNFINLFIDHIFSIDPTNRNLSYALQSMNFTEAGGEALKTRLTPFTEGQHYYGIFDSDKPFTFPKSHVFGLDLYAFSDQVFTEKFYPADKKLLEDFASRLKFNGSVRTAIIYAFAYHLLQSPNKRKILALDNLNRLINPNYFSHILSWISMRLYDSRGVMVANMNIKEITPEKDFASLQEWIKLVNTSIILPADVAMENLDTLFGLTQPEINKLSNLPTSTRMFLIKQNDQSIIAELSIGGLPAILKILSSDKETLETYEKIKQEYPGHSDNWIQPLYNALSE